MYPCRHCFRYWHLSCACFAALLHACKLPNYGLIASAGNASLKPENGMPVAMDGEEPSPKEAEQALAEAITARIAAIDAQLGKLGMLQIQ